MAKWIKQQKLTNNVYTTDANFVHDQGSPATQWVVTHNLGKKCSGVVINSANMVVIGQVTYNSVNQVTLDFQGSFSGKAYFN